MSSMSSPLQGHADQSRTRFVVAGSDRESQDAASFAGRQYLVFGLGGNRYGVDLLKIQEIKEWEQPSPMPGTPQDVIGVLNLRGVMVPVIDLRRRFGLEVAFSRETVIIVTLIHGKAVGLVVDSVSDVIQLAEGEFKAAPEVEGVEAEHIKGLATLKDGIVLLLDVDCLLVAEHLEFGDEEEDGTPVEYPKTEGAAAGGDA